jgi:hypothetical protein
MFLLVEKSLKFSEEWFSITSTFPFLCKYLCLIPSSLHVYSELSYIFIHHMAWFQQTQELPFV